MTAKQLYLRCINLTRKACDFCGATSKLEQLGEKIPFALYIRSLLSIYDIADMARLGLPWWTFTAIKEVDSFLDKHSGNARVFEYGAGASTIWLANRAKEVISVEHDPVFFPQISQLLIPHNNVSLNLVTPGCPADAPSIPSRRAGYEKMDFTEYSSRILSEEGFFDLIVIDGRARNACFSHSLNKIKPGGLIVFDNSNRKEYSISTPDDGFSKVKLFGLAPALPYPSETSLIYRKP